MRRAEADDQHALQREVVVVIVVRADYGVGRRRFRDVDDERGRVHLRVARVLVHNVARVDAVVARALRQLQLRLENRALRHLVDAHRVADRLAVRRHVVIAVRRDTLHVEDGINICRINHANALRANATKIEFARRRQPRAGEREAHVAHVRRRLGIDGPEVQVKSCEL